MKNTFKRFNYRYDEFSKSLYEGKKLFMKNYELGINDFDILLNIVCSGVEMGRLASEILAEGEINYGDFVRLVNSKDEYKDALTDSEVIRSSILEDKLLQLSNSLADAEDAVDVSRVKAQIDTIKYVMGISGSAKYSKDGRETKAESANFHFMGFGVCHNEDAAIENYKVRYGVGEQIDLVEVMDWFKSRWENPNDSVFKEEVLSQSMEELDEEYNNYT